MAKGFFGKPGIITKIRGGGGAVRGDVPHAIDPNLTWLQQMTMQHVQDRADVNDTGLAANHMVFQEPHNAMQYANPAPPAPEPAPETGIAKYVSEWAEGLKEIARKDPRYQERS